MLVEINLLPQKQKKSIFIFLIAGIVFFTFLVLFAIGYFIYDNKQQSLKNVESELELTVSLREIEEKKLTESKEVDSFSQLMTKIDWITKQKISLVFLLNHLVSLLPERGYFMNYQASDEGTVTINVQFDTPREAANYLHELNQSPYIAQASLQNLSTQEINDEENSDEPFRYLPRYIANFNIEINRVAILRAKIKEGS